jgi:hypothetical protein
MPYQYASAGSVAIDGGSPKLLKFYAKIGNPEQTLLFSRNGKDRCPGSTGTAVFEVPHAEPGANICALRDIALI